MTDLDALTAQLRKLGLTPAALHFLACLARGDTAAHIALLEAAYTDALRQPPVRGCGRCGKGEGLKRLGQSGRYCRPCYGRELAERKQQKEGMRQ